MTTQPVEPEEAPETNIDVRMDINKVQGSGKAIGAEVNTSGPVNLRADTVIYQGAAPVIAPKPARPAPPPPGDLPAPGAQPPGYRLLYSRNQFFTGRADDLLALANLLLYPAQPAAVVAAGMGGLGKTQLAVEFCWRYGAFFEGVHWITADQNMEAELATCGLALGVAPWPEKLDEQVNATLRAWHNDPFRLVVLDNANDEQTIAEWLPRLSGLRLLLTSRQEDWPEDLGLAIHRLGRLARPESLALLRRIAPRLERLADGGLLVLAERLGDLPLALDLAARYLKDVDDLTPEDYLAELQQAEASVQHDSLRDWSDHSPTRHATSLEATFLISWQKLQSTAADADAGTVEALARRIFLTCGYCAANIPIPLALVEATQAATSAPARRAVRRALKKLAGLGLCSQEQGAPALHPLLADYARSLDARSGPDQANLIGLASALSQLVSQANASGLPADFAPLRPHVEAIAPRVEAAGLEPAALLWNELGYHYSHAGLYGRAKPAFERALMLYNQTLGSRHPASITCLGNLGTLASQMGDLPQARQLLEQALGLRREVLGEQHLETAACWNNLGGVYQDMDELPLAQTSFEHALEIRRAALGEAHIDTATSLNNLGLVLRDTGDLPGARRSLEQALAVFRAVRGPQHPVTATALNNLASLLIRQNNLEEARPYYEEALAIARAVLGERHPDTGGSLNNLGMLLARMKDYPAARRSLEQALDIFLETLGERHPNSMTCLSNLSTVLYRQGDLPGALEKLQRAVLVARQLFGARHLHVATYLKQMALILQAQGDLPAAQAHLQEALAILEEKLPPGHARIQSVRASLETVKNMTQNS